MSDEEESQEEWEEVAAFFLGDGIMTPDHKGIVFSAPGVRYAANRIKILEQALGDLASDYRRIQRTGLTTDDYVEEYIETAKEMLSEGG